MKRPGGPSAPTTSCSSGWHFKVTTQLTERLPPGVVNESDPGARAGEGLSLRLADPGAAVLRAEEPLQPLEFQGQVSTTHRIRHAGRCWSTDFSARRTWATCGRGTSGLAMTSYAGCHNDVEAPISAKNNGVSILEQLGSTRGRDRRHVSDDLHLREAQRRSGPRMGFGHPGQPAEHGLAIPLDFCRPSGFQCPGRDRGQVQKQPDHASGARSSVTAKRPTRSWSAVSAPAIPAAITSRSVTVRSGSSRARQPHIRRLLANRADGDLISSDQY